MLRSPRHKVLCPFGCRFYVPDHLYDRAIALHTRVVHPLPPEPCPSRMTGVHKWTSHSPITKECDRCHTIQYQ